MLWTGRSVSRSCCGTAYWKLSLCFSPLQFTKIIDLKMFCLSCLDFHSVYYFFIKWGNSIKLSEILCHRLTSTCVIQYNKNIFGLLECTDFFRVFDFWWESHFFYISFLKNLHILYQYCYLLLILLNLNLTCYYQPPFEGSIFESWERFDYRSVLRFDNHFFLIIKQKVGYTGIYPYIFQNFFSLKNCKIPFLHKCFVFARLFSHVIFGNICDGLIFIIY